MNVLRVALLILSLLSVGLAAPVRAQGFYPAPPPNELIRVSRCDPQRTVSSGPAYYGYGPAYYPPGPYYWPDPYGYRYYQPPMVVNQEAVLNVDYTNVFTKVMGTIEFGLIANGRLVAEVRDVGTFSPQAEIKHQFGLSPNVFPLQTGLPQCVPLHIQFKDGSTWTNPHLPHLEKHIYGRPH